jgi:3-oxoacyl-[acyl-carrier-protein] synthase II
VRVRRVLVTGLGAVTPLGHTWPKTWHRLCAGHSGVERIELFDASSLPVDFAGEVKGWKPESLGRRDVRHMDRSVQFAIAAAREAVQHAGLEIPPAHPERFGIILASAVGGPWIFHKQIQAFQEGGYRKVSAHFVPNLLVDSAAVHIAIELQARGPNLAVVTACATGTNAIGEAANMIRRGDADVVLAGGTEAAVHPVVMAGLCIMRALTPADEGGPAKACKPFDRRRRGFVLGEGAGVLVLESDDHAQARGARPLAEVVGYGTSTDAYHITAPDPSGEGMAAAMRLALLSADMDPAQVDYVNAHGTGTPLNDRLETMAIKAVLGSHAYAIPISTIKAATGHMIGAAGAVEAAVCVQAMQDGVIPPTLNLEQPDPDCDLDYIPGEKRQATVNVAVSNSFGFGGHNATLILRKPAL